MPNITVTVPEEIYRAARIRAAEQGDSVSGLVADYLRSISQRDVEFERLEAKQRSVQAAIEKFSANDRLSRDALHDRAVR